MIWISNVLSGICLFLIGYSVKKFKMSYLIAGYNTSSKEEKAKYDEEKLVNFVGKLLITSSALLIAGAILALLFNKFEDGIIWSSWILFTIFILFGLVYANTGNRLKK